MDQFLHDRARNWNWNFGNAPSPKMVITCESWMERKMKLLAVTAISALALVAAVPALAGDQNTQTAINNQESLDHGQVRNQDQSRNNQADQNISGQDLASLNGQATDKSMDADVDTDGDAGVDTGAIARNDEDPNIQRMNKAAQEKTGQMDDDRAEAGKDGTNKTNPPAVE
jgi:hypothetical protein